MRCGSTRRTQRTPIPIAPKLRHGVPLWLNKAAPTRTYSTLRGRLHADIVIIGGGITGAICAYLFARAGIRVVLLESNLVARGSTAASTALLMHEPDRDFTDLAARFGRPTTRRIWSALARATRDLSATIAELRRDTDLCRCDSVYFTLEPERVAALRREFTARKKAGMPGRWLSPAALYRMTGIRAQAAILTSGNAQVDPVKTSCAFLEAAAAAGAQIFERSKARGVKASKDTVEVRTGAGRVTARRVIVATGYATAEFRGLVGRFTTKDTYVVATRRLPARVLPTGIVRGSRASGRRRRLVMAWDTSRPYHYLRWTGDGRLLVGGADTNHRSAKGSRGRIALARGRLLEYLAQVQPQLASEQPEYEWEGLFAETPDGLPYIGAHSRYPGHLFALGYGGNGMTASFLAARMMLDLYQARDKGRQQSRAQANLFAFQRGRR